MTGNGFDIPYIDESRRPITLGLAAERALGIVKTDMLEPIERASHRSMTEVYAWGQRVEVYAYRRGFFWEIQWM